jgi:hypothetical protein
MAGARAPQPTNSNARIFSSFWNIARQQLKNRLPQLMNASDGDYSAALHNYKITFITRSASVKRERRSQQEAGARYPSGGQPVRVTRVLPD